MAKTQNVDCMKLSLFSFNLLFVFSGFILLIVGFTVKTEFKELPLLDVQYVYTANILMTIAMIIFTIAMIGFYGVLKENVCMTLTFTTLLILVLFLEMALGTIALVMNQTTETHLQQLLYNSTRFYGIRKNATDGWDNLQTKFGCCGVVSYNDWSSLNKTCPISCYPQNSNQPYVLGCLQMLNSYMHSHINIIEYTGLSMGFLQLLGISISCYLSANVRKSYMLV